MKNRQWQGKVRQGGRNTGAWSDPRRRPRCKRPHPGMPALAPAMTFWMFKGSRGPILKGSSTAAIHHIVIHNTPHHTPSRFCFSVVDIRSGLWNVMDTCDIP
jgi:hypothetical protein